MFQITPRKVASPRRVLPVRNLGGSSKYGSAPAELGANRAAAFPRVVAPEYLQELSTPDDLTRFFSGQDVIIRDGVVRLGTFLQANECLFWSGPDDYPVDLLFSMEDDVDPQALKQAARAARRLTGRRFGELEDARTKALAAHLEQEMTRVYGLELPPSLTAGREMFCSTSFVRRASLPDRKLTGLLFPLLIHPESKMALILPHQYWTELAWQLYAEGGVALFKK